MKITHHKKDEDFNLDEKKRQTKRKIKKKRQSIDANSETIDFRLI